jgi:hypothetical protein
MTIVPRTQTESLLIEERDAAIARAERAERQCGEALAVQAAAVTRADRLERDIAVLSGELAEAVRRTQGERALREAAEYRCRSLDREIMLKEGEVRALTTAVDRLQREVVETSMVAESIITTPIPHEIRLEAALIEAIEMVDRVARRGGILNGDAEKLQELRRLVPS